MSEVPRVKAYEAPAAGTHADWATVNDAALVEASRAGDAAAFGTLVARHEDRVYNVCLRMLANEADALDLTQTTFLKAFDGLHKFDGRSKFATWVYRIAVNTVLSDRRRKQREREQRVEPETLEAQPAAQAAGDPSARLVGAERRAEVTRALLKLEDDYRIAVVLKDVEDLDYATIAEILQIPRGTVKSRIARGRQRLREILADWESEA